MLCVCLPVSLVYLLYAVEDLLHFLRDRYVIWAAARGGVCVCVCGQGGGAIDFLQILFA